MRDPIATIYHEDGGFTIYDCRKSETVTKPLNATALILELGRMVTAHCLSCGERLRKVEGDGPCSDCMDKQCAGKDKETAPLDSDLRAQIAEVEAIPKWPEKEAPAPA